LLVPVPVQGGTFREVEVSGHRGLLVTIRPPQAAGGGPSARPHAILTWSTADKVFAIQGPATHDGVELVEMAQSIR
jgi:hypothetical protein